MSNDFCAACSTGTTCDRCRSTASPVQGAASDDRQSMSRDDMQALCKDNPSAASGLPLLYPYDKGAASTSGEAKGAAVKPWQGRMTEAGHDSEPDPFNKLCWELEAKDAEIADWRALAERAQAAPKSAFLKHIENSSAAVEGMPAWKRNMWGEQEAAPLGLRKAAQSVVASFNDPHVSLASMQRQVNMLADALAAPVAQEAEQPQGDVMRPFGAPAGQHDAAVELLAQFVKFHDDPASVTLETIIDKKAFAAAIADVDRREAALIARAKEIISQHNLGAANTDKGGEA